ncbi:unnamed protein product [Leptidea sinapis]|uniref:Uncharacterized protein n=1 Tax=Leptidea sinapis TaxID=189913 RepID=A0A5E4Q6N5_9NEOP|nr:unnamed protein product [Leptidea sinapis]
MLTIEKSSINNMEPDIIEEMERSTPGSLITTLYPGHGNHTKNVTDNLNMYYFYDFRERMDTITVNPTISCDTFRG